MEIMTSHRVLIIDDEKFLGDSLNGIYLSLVWQSQKHGGALKLIQLDF